MSKTLPIDAKPASAFGWAFDELVHALARAARPKCAWLASLGSCLLISCVDEPTVQDPAGQGSALSARDREDHDHDDDHHHRPHWDPEVDEAPDDEASYVFDPWKVRTYELVIDPVDLARIDRKPSAEETVPATLLFEGRTIGPLGVRYKGSVGSFLAPCTATDQLGVAPGPKVGKCAMKIAFDDVDKSARFYGLKKLNFHPMGRDPSMMRERLGYQLYRDMGIAAPRTMYARVFVNGKLEGLFLAVEQIDGEFTKSRFRDGGKGNLYKEVWPLYGDPAVYRKALETNKGAATDVGKMLRFRAAIAKGPDTGLSWLDQGYMMRYLAVDRVIQNDDGMAHWYCNAQQGNNLWPLGNHNYYWYESPTADRQWLVPWDLDSSFANHPRVHILTEWSVQPEEPTDCYCRARVGLPQRAPSCDRLTAALAGLASEYQKAVETFVRGPFSARVTNARLAFWAHQIAPHVAEAAGVLGAPDTAAWRTALDALRTIIADTRAHRGYDYSDEDPFPPLPPRPDAGAPRRDVGRDAGRDAGPTDAGRPAMDAQTLDAQPVTSERSEVPEEQPPEPPAGDVAPPAARY